MPRVVEIFFKFLALGCVSFGGPAAHIGYFRIAFVQKLNWIDNDSYAKLVALSQFLPGPGSSQVGFAIGLRRAGIFGGVAAFLGFTLPSFLLLYLLAVIGLDASDHGVFTGIIVGLKLLAVVVVADACISMFKSFCQDKLSISLAVGATILLLVYPSLWTQMAILIIAGCMGACFRRTERVEVRSNKRLRISLVPFILFLVIFIGLPLLATNNQILKLFSDFYYAGSLVFGGGHVVLPLLQQSVGDAISTDQFLTGYAAAQAVPGPMFSLATYLGASLLPDNQFLAATVATIAIFSPGFLLILALQNTWESLTNIPSIEGAVAGINAAVVGLLLAALYQPIFVSAVMKPLDMALVILGLFFLRVMSVPIVWLVAGFAAVGVIVQL